MRCAGEQQTFKRTNPLLGTRLTTARAMSLRFVGLPNCNKRFFIIFFFLLVSDAHTSVCLWVQYRGQQCNKRFCNNTTVVQGLNMFRWSHSRIAVEFVKCYRFFTVHWVCFVFVFVKSQKRSKLLIPVRQTGKSHLKRLKYVKKSQ